MTLETSEYVRKPFKVNVIELTVANMEEVNTLHKLGTLEKKDDDTPYIAISTNKGGAKFRVFAGYFVVEMGRHTRCFSRKVFFQQFDPMDDAWRMYFGRHQTVG